MSVDNFMETVLAFHLFNGLWGPNSGHQAGPASHLPISKTVLKNFMHSWAF